MVSCSNCRESHTACNNERPCKRCVKTGRAATCRDAVAKKRGRKRTGPAALIDDTLDSFSSLPSFSFSPSACASGSCASASSSSSSSLPAVPPVLFIHGGSQNLKPPSQSVSSRTPYSTPFIPSPSTTTTAAATALPFDPLVPPSCSASSSSGHFIPATAPLMAVPDEAGELSPRSAFIYDPTPSSSAAASGSSSAATSPRSPRPPAALSFVQIHEAALRESKQQQQQQQQQQQEEEQHLFSSSPPSSSCCSTSSLIDSHSSSPQYHSFEEGEQTEEAQHQYQQRQEEEDYRSSESERKRRRERTNSSSFSTAQHNPQHQHFPHQELQGGPIMMMMMNSLQSMFKGLLKENMEGMKNELSELKALLVQNQKDIQELKSSLLPPPSIPSEVIPLSESDNEDEVELEQTERKEEEGREEDLLPVISRPSVNVAFARNIYQHHHPLFRVNTNNSLNDHLFSSFVSSSGFASSVFNAAAPSFFNTSSNYRKRLPCPPSYSYASSASMPSYSSAPPSAASSLPSSSSSSASSSASASSSIPAAENCCISSDKHPLPPWLATYQQTITSKPFLIIHNEFSQKNRIAMSNKAFGAVFGIKIEQLMDKPADIIRDLFLTSKSDGRLFFGNVEFYKRPRGNLLKFSVNTRSFNGKNKLNLDVSLQRFLGETGIQWSVLIIESCRSTPLSSSSSSSSSTAASSSFGNKDNYFSKEQPSDTPSASWMKEYPVMHDAPLGDDEDASAHFMDASYGAASPSMFPLSPNFFSC